MVIGGKKINEEMGIPLIDKEDPIHNLENEYEKFMYSANQFESNIFNLSYEKIKESLKNITDTVNNLNQIISTILDKEKNDDDFQKIKLISFNVSNKCEEIYNKVDKFEKNSSSEIKLENLNIIEEAENLKQISKNINHDVSIKILKANNQLFNFEKYNEELQEKRTLEKKKREEEMKEVENTITDTCFIGIIIIFSALIFVYYGFGVE
jgi:hypothetical protein